MSTIIVSKVCPDCLGEPIAEDRITEPKEGGLPGETETRVLRDECGRCEGTGSVKLCPNCGSELDLGLGFDEHFKRPDDHPVGLRCGRCETDFPLSELQG